MNSYKCKQLTQTPFALWRFWVEGLKESMSRVWVGVFFLLQLNSLSAVPQDPELYLALLNWIAHKRVTSLKYKKKSHPKNMQRLILSAYSCKNRTDFISETTLCLELILSAFVWHFFLLISATISHAWNIKYNSKPAMQSCFIYEAKSSTTTWVRQTKGRWENGMRMPASSCGICFWHFKTCSLPVLIPCHSLGSHK